MSGRTFGVQSSWDEVFKVLGLEIEPKTLRKASGIADSMNQQIEEHINRFSVSASNDSGDLTFDASGSYTFNGDVVVNGDLTLDTGDIIFGDPTDTYGVINSTIETYATGLWAGMQMFSGAAGETEYGFIGVGNFSLEQWFGIRILSPAHALITDQAYLDVYVDDSTNTNGVAVNGDFFASNATDAYFFGDQIHGPITDVSAPGYTFWNDPDTGMFRYAEDEIGFAVGSDLGALIDTNGYIHTAGKSLYFGINSNDYLSYNDTGTGYFSFVIDGSVQGYVGSAAPVGSYGTFFAEGTGKGSYEGFNAAAELVFMSNNSNNGIYDDLNNQWLYYIPALSTTLDNNRASLMLEADAADADLDYHAHHFTPNTDTGGGASGGGWMVFNDELGGFTGTAGHITTSTVSSITGKRLGFLSSKAEGKHDTSEWAMPQEAYLRLKPTSFVVNNMYVDEYGNHHNWDGWRALDLEDTYDPPPENWVPLRRYGLMWDDLIADEDLWPIATDLSWSAESMSAATVTQVQDLIRRVEALEGKKNK